jgi:hypothetical protein
MRNLLFGRMVPTGISTDVPDCLLRTVRYALAFVSSLLLAGATGRQQCLMQELQTFGIEQGEMRGCAPYARRFTNRQETRAYLSPWG